MTTTPLADQEQRQRFVGQHDRNFSVVASAGSGKTRAITDRLVALAQNPESTAWLPSLVVVTYTNRAADEMRQRARQALLDSGANVRVLAAFGHVFFGTIHSFCLKLLREHGHFLGLPTRLDLVADDEALWREFIQHQSTLGTALTPAQRRDLLRLAPARRLLELGRLAAADLTVAGPAELPPFDFSSVYAYTAKGSAAKTIPGIQERLRAWERAWQEETGYLPLPTSSSKAQEFAALWRDALSPIREWMRKSALQVGADLATTYQRFRLARGVVTFDDQVQLALNLLRHPEAGPLLRHKGYRIILDEAQDTDPVQFSVLLELARPAEATGIWPLVNTDPPRPGHFSMVGDFQQSIYGKRADLSFYRQVHDALVASGAGESLKFSVTFRLDDQLIDGVNRTFPAVFDPTSGQVEFVSLHARPGVLPGQIVRLPISPLLEPEKPNLVQKMKHESEELAEWIATAGLAALRARAWGEVAIICPRTRWFAPLRDALRQKGLDVQIQSERELRGDTPAFAWLTALVTIMADPADSFEVAGVLRELYGLSDHDLAVHADGNGDRLHLASGHPGFVGAALEELHLLRERILPLPLFAAVEEIIHTTRLADRLAALPDDIAGEYHVQLEALLTAAATEEVDGAGLIEFAARLKADFSATREVRGSRPGAIQLITGHKAKGSEWDAVIVPAFAREVYPFSPRYPYILRDPASGEMLVALDSDEVQGELKDLVAQRNRQEQERLLYVALTRARHTLVLVDDLQLFGGKNGPGKNAQAALFRCGLNAANAEHFANWPQDPRPCAQTARWHAERKATPPLASTLLDLAPTPSGLLDQARARAARFIKRNPSALVIGAELHASAKVTTADLDTLARYGTWWHLLMETLDWNAPLEAWDTTFAEAMVDTPDEVRANREWAAFRAQIESGGPLAQAMRGPGLVRQIEMPFLWRMTETECLEGIMDVAVYDPKEKEWLILDWKTNPIDASDLPELHEHYRPQLSAYWHALTDATGAKVRAALYSTVCAAWLPYTTEELKEQWAAIVNQPESIAEAIAED